MDSCEIGTSCHRKPTNAANETLICLRSAGLSGRVVGICQRSNRIDKNPRPIWGRQCVCITGFVKETFHEVLHKTCLVQVNQDQGQGDLPREVNTKKPLNDPHKIYFAMLAEKAAK
jgi:hypothetical protein